MDDLMWALQCQQKAEQSLAALKDLAGQALFTYHSLCVCHRAHVLGHSAYPA